MAKTYDIDKINRAYEDAKSTTRTERHSLERDWFRNCLYYLGIQWITYNNPARRWMPRTMQRWVPRPVTNKFSVAANTIVQALSQKAPDARCRPGTGSAEDVACAEIADKNLDIIGKEIDEELMRTTIALWITLTGTAIVHAFYDNDPIHGGTTVNKCACGACGASFSDNEIEEIEVDSIGAESPMQSAEVPAEGAGTLPPAPEQNPDQVAVEKKYVCPECGSDNISMLTDEKGSILQELLPNGKTAVEVFSPFEVYVDLEARSENEIQQLLIRRRYNLDKVRRWLDDPTIEADNSSGSDGATGQNLLRAIAYAHVGGSMGIGGGTVKGMDAPDQSVTVDQLWVKPCTEYPQGLVAIYVGGQIRNEKELKNGIPYKKMVNGKEEVIWPWHFVQFDPVPGRIFGRTPMDDVAPKQEQRNKLESLIQLIITRTASSQWLFPKGVGIAEITGEPGQVIEYNISADPRLRPERVPGENVPTTVMAWLEKIDNDIEEISGTWNIMKGQAPSGVTAGTALRLLLEKANTRFTPVLRRTEIAYGKIMTDALCIFQQFATEERINAIQGPGKTWEVKRFKAADIAGGSMDVVVETGSSIPRSIVGEQALVQDLTSMGAINPTLPDTQYKILERFGATNFLGETDENIKQAERENWHFINENKKFVLNPIIDEHTVHLRVHRALALKSDYETWPDEKRQALDDHILEHMTIMMQMSAMQQMQGAPGQEGQPAGGNGEPSKETKQDKKQAPMPGGNSNAL